jgi:hypothetical protein
VKITTDKIFETGDKVICILPSNSKLELGKIYTVKRFQGKFKTNKFASVILEELSFRVYNVGRFVSVSEVRDFQINKIIDNE